LKLSSIQMLRGIAALMVALFHLRGLEADAHAKTGVAEAPLIPVFWENGLVGVDLFFVISGFIMVYVTGAAKPGPGTAGAFLFARAARIYPLWWLFAGAMATYYIVSYGVPFDAERPGGAGVTGTEHLWKSFLLIPQPGYPVLSLGWTLIHEMYFYLVFALTLLIARKALPLVLAVWSALVLGFALAGVSTSHPATLAQLAISPMTLEFIAGAFAGLLFNSGRRFAPLTVTLTGTGVLIAAMVLVTPPRVAAELGDGPWAQYFLEWGRVVYFGLPAVLIVYGVASLEAAGRFREFRPLTWLGDWSYALYLSHILVFAAVRRVLPVGEPGMGDNILYIALALPAALITAALTYQFFERPLMRLFGRARAGLFGRSNDGLKPQPVRTSVW
jgi:exopolysaccharide production protein ExoZ